MLARQKTETPLDLAIAEVFRDLETVNADSDEYTVMVSNLVKLNSIKDDHPKGGVTPDTWVLAATNLIGIALILQHERLHAISSKAFNLLLKMR